MWLGLELGIGLGIGLGLGLGLGLEQYKNNSGELRHKYPVRYIQYYFGTYHFGTSDFGTRPLRYSRVSVMPQFWDSGALPTNNPDPDPVVAITLTVSEILLLLLTNANIVILGLTCPSDVHDFAR